MAAPDGKASPSNQPVQEPSSTAPVEAVGKAPPTEASSTLKAPPTYASSTPKAPPTYAAPATAETPAPVAAAAAPASTTAAAVAAPAPQEETEPEDVDVQVSPAMELEQLLNVMNGAPTYVNSEATIFYQDAKRLLVEGDFETALTRIEAGINACQSLLLQLGMQEVDLHESLAPFHYLYGTTLLYSLEESSSDQQQMTASAPGEDDELADDMQIAWENLEAARTIVQTMLTTVPQTQVQKLELDLAQIYLRSADLQRMNGRYPDAIQDYHACLELRLKYSETLGPRKLADVYTNLGLSYLNSSTELQKELSPEESVGVNLAERQALSVEHLQQGLEHYLQSAKMLLQRAAALCGTSIQEDSNKVPAVAAAAAAAPTTSEQSQQLSALRTQLDSWKVTSADPDDQDEFTDLKLFVEEIQETMDNAGTSVDALKQASHLKIQAQQAAEGKPTTDADGVTTQIGFGGATSTTTTEQNPWANLNVKPAATEDDSSKKPAATMMVVKKKKKRDAPEEETKKPAAQEQKKNADDASNKKPRTEE